jgi:hypothetical protein
VASRAPRLRSSKGAKGPAGVRAEKLHSLRIVIPPLSCKMIIPGPYELPSGKSIQLKVRILLLILLLPTALFSQDTLSIQEVDEAPWLNPETEPWPFPLHKKDVIDKRLLPLNYSYPGITKDLKGTALFKVSFLLNTTGILILEHLELVNRDELLSSSSPRVIRSLRIKKYRTLDDSRNNNPEASMSKRELKKFSIRIEKEIRSNVASFPRMLAGQERGKPVVTRYIQYINYVMEIVDR